MKILAVIIIVGIIGVVGGYLFRKNSPNTAAKIDSNVDKVKDSVSDIKDNFKK